SILAPVWCEMYLVYHCLYRTIKNNNRWCGRFASRYEKKRGEEKYYFCPSRQYSSIFNCLFCNVWHCYEFYITFVEIGCYTGDFNDDCWNPGYIWNYFGKNIYTYKAFICHSFRVIGWWYSSCY